LIIRLGTHEREAYMLYRKMTNKSMKHESKVLPTGTGGDRNYMCYDEQKRGHSIQGSMALWNYI
jgi:hypothetical protein